MVLWGEKRGIYLPLYKELKFHPPLFTLTLIFQFRSHTHVFSSPSALSTLIRQLYPRITTLLVHSFVHP